MTLGTRLSAAANIAAKRTSALNFAATMVRVLIGMAPSTEASRASTARPSHASSVTSAVAVMAADVNRKWSKSADTEATPGVR